MESFRETFTAPAGEEQLNVEVYQPNGEPGNYYHININNYCYGSITKRNGEWVRLHINIGELTVDDVQALGEIIDEYVAGLILG